MADILTLPRLEPSAIKHIVLPTPRMGGKIWLLEQKGIFVLERGAGSLGTIACTHAGAGTLQAIDGIPDDRGFFPDADMPEDHPDYYARNGRPIYHASAAVMGSWWMGGGFWHGLTIISMGGAASVNAIASIVWSRMREPNA